ncbi:MAG: CDP-alcohol phosphatidyltransferase family protein [Bacteroidota bacterium]
MDLNLRIQNWTRYHAGLILAGSILALLIDWTAALDVFAVVSFGAYFLLFQDVWKPKGLLGGPANQVTAFRLLGLLTVLFLHPYLPDWGIAIGAILVLALDGLDGYLARKYQLSSRFGGIFDMETDAFFVMGMSLLLFQKELAPAWVLLLGWIKYGYELLLIVFPPKRVEKGTMLGKIIAVVLMISLIAPLLLPAGISQFMLMTSAILLLYSFGRSFYETVIRSER